MYEYKMIWKQGMNSYMQFFKIVLGKILGASAARSWINSFPKTEATTFLLPLSFFFGSLCWSRINHFHWCTLKLMQFTGQSFYYFHGSIAKLENSVKEIKAGNLLEQNASSLKRWSSPVHCTVQYCIHKMLFFSFL